MELRQLRYFLAVVDAGSFSAAAREIHIAQPALTRQIKTLEETLGVRLLERHVSGVKLTVAGTCFYEDVMRITQQLDKSVTTIQMMEKGMLGELSIGVTVMMLWVRRIREGLKHFRATYPNMMLQINTLLSGPQVNALRQGTLDAGFLMFPPSDLASMTLFDDSLVLVVPNDSPLALHPPQSLKAIGDYGFVWFNRENSPAYHDELMSFFHQNGFVPNIIEKGNDSVTMLSVVASGVGCTIVPKITLFGGLEDLTVIELPDLTLPIELKMVWNPDRMSPALVNLIEIMAPKGSMVP